MLTWAVADLAAARATAGISWIIAVFHHPPYTRGSHDSDVEVELIQMRSNALPILEANGVDLVLSGHSHSYERSYLIDGHYGLSTSYSQCAHLLNGGSGVASTPYVKPTGLAANSGTVYVVTGSAGKTEAMDADGPLPNMKLTSMTLGSFFVDVNGDSLTATFLTSTGTVLDTFKIEKQAGYVVQHPYCLRRQLRAQSPQ
jgi:hypothetical protein